MSIRITKGVYYRTGGFKGYPVEKEETIHVDKGILAVTTKHIYFYGPNKSFRIPYSKIVSFTPYSDGIGIQRMLPVQNHSFLLQEMDGSLIILLPILLECEIIRKEVMLYMKDVVL